MWNLFQINSEDTGAMWDICSKLATKTPEQCVKFILHLKNKDNGTMCEICFESKTKSLFFYSFCVSGKFHPLERLNIIRED